MSTDIDQLAQENKKRAFMQDLVTLYKKHNIEEVDGSDGVVFYSMDFEYDTRNDMHNRVSVERDIERLER